MTKNANARKTAYHQCFGVVMTNYVNDIVLKTEDNLFVTSL